MVFRGLSIKVTKLSSPYSFDNIDIHKVCGFSEIADIVIFETPNFLAGQSIFHLINCVNKVVEFNLIFSEHLLT